MKNPILCTATRACAFLMCACSWGMAQGTINFANNGASLVTTNDLGDIGVAQVGRVQLLWASAGTPFQNPGFIPSLASLLSHNPGWMPVASSITPIGPVPGRFIGGAVTIPTPVPGPDVELAVLGWTGNFETFDAAKQSFQSICGVTGAFTVTTGNPTTTPAGLPAIITGPGQFSGLVLVYIPEPSIAALFVLGVGLALRGRLHKR